MFSIVPSLAWALLASSVVLSGVFCVYGFNTLHLTIRARRYRPGIPGSLVEKPTVAIHLPIYNELYVVRRLLSSCAGMAESYGKDRVGIVVIDDSTDETSAELDRIGAELRERGLSIEVVRRTSRSGYKAGALQSAFVRNRAKYVVVLDADFVPPADFLDRAIPFLELDPKVGFVQGRWGHLDRGFNAITESVAIGVDAHFLLEQQGRNGSGYFMNFNGSAGVIRAQAINRAGGWSSDTLAEDLDLSYRMQLSGYRGVYLGDLEVPAELPPTITSLKRQQGRWARGSLQTARKLLGRIGKSEELTMGQKVEAGIHLTYYLVHPLMVASFLLAVAAVFLQIDVIRYAVNIQVPTLQTGNLHAGVSYMSLQVVPWLVFSVLIGASTFSVLLYCIEAVRAQKLGLLRNIREILLLVVLGYGISISNSVNALQGIFSKDTGTFSRTPKYAIDAPGQTWKGKKYQIPFNRISLLESGAVALALAALVRAIQTGNVGILPVLAIYLIGYAFVLSLTVQQTFESRGSRDLG